MDENRWNEKFSWKPGDLQQAHDLDELHILQSTNPAMQIDLSVIDAALISLDKPLQDCREERYTQYVIHHIGRWQTPRRPDRAPLLSDLNGEPLGEREVITLGTIELRSLGQGRTIVVFSPSEESQPELLRKVLNFALKGIAEVPEKPTKKQKNFTHGGYRLATPEERKECVEKYRADKANGVIENLEGWMTANRYYFTVKTLYNYRREYDQRYRKGNEQQE